MTKHKKRRLDTQNASKSLQPKGKTQPGSKIYQPAKKPSTRKPDPTIPFDAADRILLIGEGDFSFAKSIVEHHGCYDVTATCYDSKDQLFEKYTPQAEQHIQYLETEGQNVLYGVDATKFSSIKALAKAPQFDRVIFNFPHVGGKSKDVNRQVRFNQELLVKFFAAAQTLLTPEGTIVVTLFEGEPYTLWNIRDLARHSGLEVQRSFKFVAEVYLGYSHSRTLGNVEGGGGWKGEEREARTFVLKRKVVQEVKGSGKRKRGGESEDEEG